VYGIKKTSFKITKLFASVIYAYVVKKATKQIDVFTQIYRTSRFCEQGEIFMGDSHPIEEHGCWKICYG
jgi:hypothetical protein